jgi:diguanylate cyclase (GGDEF)-like protein
MRDHIKIQLLKNILDEVTKRYDDVIEAQNKALEEHFERAIKDPLTGLYNRYYLFDYTSKSLQKLNREHKCAIVVFFDLDNFKYVNDHFGHKEGDRVLTEVAHILKSTFRSYDIVARLGGDEFAVYIESPIHQNNGQEELEKLLTILVQRIETRFQTYQISASYGTAIFPREGENLNELIEIADKRMYEMKREKQTKHSSRMLPPYSQHSTQA